MREIESRRKRKLKRARLSATVFGVLFLAASAFGWYAYEQKRRAMRNGFNGQSLAHGDTVASLSSDAVAAFEFACRKFSNSLATITP